METLDNITTELRRKIDLSTSRRKVVTYYYDYLYSFSFSFSHSYSPPPPPSVNTLDHWLKCFSLEPTKIFSQFVTNPHKEEKLHIVHGMIRHDSQYFLRLVPTRNLRFKKITHRLTADVSKLFCKLVLLTSYDEFNP